LTIENLSFHGLTGFEISCDFCSFSQEYETDHWPTLMAEMKKDGWKSRKDKNDEWEHVCQDCAAHGK
jgi:hypothetical protein